VRSSQTHMIPVRTVHFCPPGRLAGRAGSVGVRTYGEKETRSFKKRLEERQRELRYAMTRTAQDGRDADVESAQDIADRAANSYNKEFLFHQSNNDRQLAADGGRRTRAHTRGQFGQCISCGEEINAKRLEAVPWTRHCIECQEKLEKGILEHSSI
jgi:DnaK suppressor protein